MREDWVLRAACRDIDVELFYDEAHERAALALCARCEVRTTCLAVAMDRRDPFGVWGGTPERHRRRIFRAERRPDERLPAEPHAGEPAAREPRRDDHGDERAA